MAASLARCTTTNNIPRSHPEALGQLTQFRLGQTLHRSLVKALDHTPHGHPQHTPREEIRASQVMTSINMAPPAPACNRGIFPRCQPTRCRHAHKCMSCLRSEWRKYAEHSWPVCHLLLPI